MLCPSRGCREEEKAVFWENFDNVMQKVEGTSRPVIAGDLNGHVSGKKDGEDRVNGDHGLGDRNAGEEVVDFAQAYDLVIANTYFCKRNSHLVTYSSGGRETY